MRILLANKFFFPKGGAETSFFNTANLLEKMGHKVMFFSMKHPLNLPSIYEKYFVSNIDYEFKGLGNRLSAASRLLYSFEAKEKIERLIKEQKPDIAHLHNIHHQISPSVLTSLRKFRIPIVLTLHDYKMACPSYSMMYNGKICAACGSGKYYRCFLKRCNKGSRIKSLLSTMEMYLHHKVLRIYKLADIFISPSMFLKCKLEEMGFKGNVIHLPNFIESGNAPEYNWDEKSIVYFGRLSGEKGLFDLIDAVKDIRGATLRIIGEGPLEGEIKNKISAQGINNVILLGYKKGEDLKNEITKSMFVILPSVCFENNPMSIIEAFSLGRPVIGSRIGGIPELVKDGRTGLSFEAGNHRDLRVKIEDLINNPRRVMEMGKNARLFVDKEFSAEKHYRGLMEIYSRVMKKFISTAMALILLGALSGCFKTAPAKDAYITIYGNREMGQINRKVFGANFLGYNPATYEDDRSEYYGYSDYGAGIWDPWHKRSVREVAGLAKDSGVSIARFPGGCGAHRYDWKNTIGKNRGHFLYGVDEFLKTCEEIGAEAVITVSYFIGSEQDAADLVEYLLSPDDGSNPNGGMDWAKERSLNGHSAPYFNAKYFEIDNETYHGDHRDIKGVPPEEYANRYLKYYEAMKFVDPKINIGVVLCPIYWDDWNRRVLSAVKDKVDFGIVHTYPAPEEGELRLGEARQIFEISLGVPVFKDEVNFQDTLKLLKEESGKDVPLAITEYNAGFVQEKPVPYRHCLGAALINAELVRIFMKPEHKILMANYWQFCNSYWGMIRSQEDFAQHDYRYPIDYIKRPNYYVFELYNKHFGPELIMADVECGFYRARGFSVPYLTVNASADRDKSKIYLMVVNKNLGEPVCARVYLKDFFSPRKGDVWILNGPGIDATNEELPYNVKVTSRKFGITGNSFEFTFEPHSLTAIEITGYKDE